jgi:hypothetical protein
MALDNCGTNCFIPPPLYPGPDGRDAAWCVSNCGPCVPKKRRYADCEYITITPAVKKTFIRMLNSRQYPAQVDPGRLNIYIEIRYRGCNELIACYNAFQRTLEGYVGFYWDATFTEACAGLYVGDVYVDCEYCFSIHFRIPKCELIVDSCYNEFAAEDCGKGECSMVPTVGAGVVGGTTCPTPPPSGECGLPAPFFETTDPAVPEEADAACNASCAPASHFTGGTTAGSI